MHCSASYSFIGVRCIFSITNYLYNLIRILHILVLVMLPFISVAQIYNHFTAQNGLPSDKVYGVHEDKTGFIWVYTANGVALYDGYDFKHYNPNNGLATNDIWDIWEDSQGRLWCRSYGRHITYIQNSKAKKVFNPYADVLDLTYFREVDGQLFVGRANTPKTGPYWYKIKNDTLTEVENTKANSLFDWAKKRQMICLGALTPSYFVCEKRDSLIFFNYKFNEINRYKKNVKKTYVYSQQTIGIVNPFINEDWGFSYDGTSLNRMSLLGSLQKNISYLNFKFNPNGIKSFRVGDNLVLSNGLGDLIKLDTLFNLVDRFQYSIDERISGLSHANIDSRGNIWISTLNNGLLFLPKSKRMVKVLKLHDGQGIKAPNIIRSIQGKIYIGGVNGSLFEYKNGKESCLISDKMSSTVDIREILSVNGDLLLGSAKLLRINNNGIQNLSKEFVTFDTKINIKSLAAKGGDSYFYSNGIGVFLAKPKEVQVKEIVEKRVYSMVYQANKGLWMGGASGLYFWDEKKGRSFFYITRQFTH
jgi:hypothetical protein